MLFKFHESPPWKVLVMCTTFAILALSLLSLKGSTSSIASFCKEDCATCYHGLLEGNCVKRWPWKDILLVDPWKYEGFTVLSSVLFCFSFICLLHYVTFSVFSQFCYCVLVHHYLIRFLFCFFIIIFFWFIFILFFLSRNWEEKIQRA